MDNSYEKIITMMRSQGAVNNSAEVQIGVMTGQYSCKVGDLNLGKEDLLFNELLLRPQTTTSNGTMTASGNISVSCIGGGGSFSLNSSANIEESSAEWTSNYKLKAGDIVAVTKITEDTYAILGRLVKA